MSTFSNTVIRKNQKWILSFFLSSLVSFFTSSYVTYSNFNIIFDRKREKNTLHLHAKYSGNSTDLRTNWTNELTHHLSHVQIFILSTPIGVTTLPSWLIWFYIMHIVDFMSNADVIDCLYPTKCSFGIYAKETFIELSGWVLRIHRNKKLLSII